jgi:hypothetical protein
LQQERAFSFQRFQSDRSFNLQQDQFNRNKTRQKTQDALAAKNQDWQRKFQEMNLYGQYVVSNLPEYQRASVMSELLRS